MHQEGYATHIGWWMLKRMGVRSRMRLLWRTFARFRAPALPVTRGIPGSVRSIMREALLVPNCTSTFLARTGESRDMLGAAFYEVLYCHVRTVLQMTAAGHGKAS